MSCDTCRYAHQPEDSVFLECRRYPPHEVDGMPQFPIVSEREWCGEYKSKFVSPGASAGPVETRRGAVPLLPSGPVVGPYRPPSIVAGHGAQGEPATRPFARPETPGHTFSAESASAPSPTPRALRRIRRKDIA